MDNKEFKFDYPLTMTWFQIVFALGCCFVTYPLNKVVPALGHLPNLEFNFEKAKQILSLSVIFVLMVGFNNLCLKFVDVSFYQVARSLSVLFTLIFGYFLLSDSSSWESIGACFVVIAGYVIGNVSEVREMKFSFLGVFFGLASSAFVALNGIYVKKALKVVNNDEWLLLLYNTIIAIVLLGPLAFIFEFDGVRKVPFLFDPRFIWYMCITAFLGWLINIAIYLQIKYTSALTNAISGTVKACVQTLLAIVFWESNTSSIKLFGILLCIGGSFLYSHFKKLENEKKRKEEEKRRESEKV